MSPEVNPEHVNATVQMLADKLGVAVTELVKAMSQYEQSWAIAALVMWGLVFVTSLIVMVVNMRSYSAVRRVTSMYNKCDKCDEARLKCDEARLKPDHCINDFDDYINYYLGKAISIIISAGLSIVLSIVGMVMVPGWVAAIMSPKGAAIREIIRLF